jgi:hypothetical protein
VGEGVIKRPADAWLTADDVIKAGACADGVHSWMRRRAKGETALPVEDALSRARDSERPYITAAVGGYGNGSGYGNGNGYGSGYGSGYGDGNGYGNGSGYGDGNGYGNGYGDGYGGSQSAEPDDEDDEDDEDG